MNIVLQNHCQEINWEEVSHILEEVNMAFYEPCVHKKAFENSYTVLFVFDDQKLIGFGRSISDGAYQAAIYDVAVRPSYQSLGIGRLIINSIMSQLDTFNVILYAAPGKEAFYQKMNFRKLKTGMAHFYQSKRAQGAGITE